MIDIRDIRTPEAHKAFLANWCNLSSAEKDHYRTQAIEILSVEKEKMPRQVAKETSVRAPRRKRRRSR